MKKFLIAFLMAAFLVGCSSGPAAVSSSGETDTLPENTLTEQDVVQVYRDAAQVYNWFNLGSLPVSGDPVTVEEEDMVYYPVAYEGLETYADLEGKVRSLFSSALADEILSESGNYRDIDGRLYCADGARGSNIYLMDTTVRAREADTEHWTVELLFWTNFSDDTETTIGYSREVLNYEMTDDGFRFTNFCPSDALDVEADTVLILHPENLARPEEFSSLSTWQLVCTLLYADEALTESGAAELTRRFVDDPSDVLNALATLNLSPFRSTNGADTVDALMIAPARSGAELPEAQREEFERVLNSCTPESDDARAVLKMIRTAYQSAVST